LARPRTISDEAILRATRRCLLEEGGAVPTTRIAAVLGISQATLFQRFGTKEKLFIAAARPGESAQALESFLAVGPDDRPIHEQLCEIGVGLSLMFERRYPLFQALRSVGIGHEQVFAGMAVPPPIRGHRALVAWLDRAQSGDQLGAVDTTLFAAAFAGSIYGRFFIELLSGEALIAHSREEFLDDLVRLLLQGAQGGTDER
jgi:AcrR family transcriptional regulator